MHVSGVLLAAGASARFGSPKMLAPVPPERRPMLAHVIDTWRGAGFAEIVVVLGKDARVLQGTIEEDLLRMSRSGGDAGARDARPGAGGGLPAALPLDAAAAPPAPVRFVENRQWEHGMFSSVRAGLAALRPDSTHAAISPADLPFLSTSTLRTVLEALSLPESTDTVVVPTCGRRRGHPLVIPAALVARVLAWPDDARLNRLFAEPDVKVLHLPGFDETVLTDVDRPVDLLA